MAHKVVGYDFSIVYKKGKENKAANALSRRDEGGTNPTLSVISFPHSTWLEELRKSYTIVPNMSELFTKVQIGVSQDTNFTLRNEILLRMGCIYLSKTTGLKDQVLQHIHNSPKTGHSGYHKTLHRARSDFYLPGMKNDIRTYVRECDTCQRNNTETIAPAGLLQNLPIPHQSWTNISMDFIEGLPISRGNTNIFVVVDRFTKYAHFIETSHPYSAYAIAHLFIAHVSKHHGMPTTIVSDRDSIFLSNF